MVFTNGILFLNYSKLIPSLSTSFPPVQFSTILCSLALRTLTGRYMPPMALCSDAYRSPLAFSTGTPEAFSHALAQAEVLANIGTDLLSDPSLVTEAATVFRAEDSA